MIRTQKVNTYLFKHFGEHGIQHLIVTGLEIDLQWTESQRRRKEYTWIQGLQTWTPSGFNQR